LFRRPFGEFVILRLQTPKFHETVWQTMQMRQDSSAAYDTETCSLGCTNKHTECGAPHIHTYKYQQLYFSRIIWPG
jgi:hypothetical protein